MEKVTTLAAIPNVLQRQNSGGRPARPPRALAKVPCHATIDRVLRPAALLLILIFLLSSGAQAQEGFEIPSVTIAGGQLAESVHLAPADADAFRRRLNLLPRLDEEPEVQGASYSVTSSYWSSAVRLE